MEREQPAEAVIANLQGLTKCCAWCGRYEMGGVWIVRADTPNSLDATHGICPDCIAELRAKNRSVAVTAARIAGKALTPPGAGLFELQCSSCGYGVVVRVAPVQCPMCKGSVWQRVVR